MFTDIFHCLECDQFWLRRKLCSFVLRVFCLCWLSLRRAWITHAHFRGHHFSTMPISRGHHFLCHFPWGIGCRPSAECGLVLSRKSDPADILGVKFDDIECLHNLKDIIGCAICCTLLLNRSYHLSFFVQCCFEKKPVIVEHLCDKSWFWWEGNICYWTFLDKIKTTINPILDLLANQLKFLVFILEDYINVIVCIVSENTKENNVNI